MEIIIFILKKKKKLQLRIIAFEVYLGRSAQPSHSDFQSA